MLEPIRVDMSRKDSNFGELLMEALMTGRPMVMFDSTNPLAGEVGFGLELGAANAEAGERDDD